MSWVRVEDVSVAYRNTPVLDKVNLSIHRGELVAVLGPSGCGKTTLLRAIAGHLPLAAGHVFVGPRELSSAHRHVPPERRDVGWVPQDASLFPHLSVSDNIGFGLRRGRARVSRISELVDLVGLSGMAGRAPHALSGGQAQRVALARALAPKPDVVLLDEPFTALDPTLRSALRLEVVALLRDQGATALLVTHDQEEALSLADRVAVMRDGRILQIGTARQVYEEPVDPWVAAFVGDVVEIPGHATDDRVVTALGNLPVARGDARGEVRVILRPEWIRLDARAGTPGRVESVRYAGHDALVEVSIGGGIDLLARSVATRLPSRGDLVSIAVEHGALLYPVEREPGLITDG